MKLDLPQLSALSWGALCVALSVIGSVILALAFAIIGGLNLTTPFFLAAKLQDLFYLIGFSLIINLLGAIALAGIRSIRNRRAQPHAPEPSVASGSRPS